MRDVWLAAVAAAIVACHRETKQDAPGGDAPSSASPTVAATAPSDSAPVAVDTASAPSASAPGPVASKASAAAPTATGLGGIGTIGIGNVSRNSCGAVSRTSGICGAVSQTEVRGPTATITTSLSGATQANDDRVVATLRPRLRMCANKALQRDPTLAGKVVLSISVAANGEVSQTSVVSDTGVGAEMAACMTSMARRAQFDPGPARTLTLTIIQTHD